MNAGVSRVLLAFLGFVAALCLAGVLVWVFLAAMHSPDRDVQERFSFALMYGFAFARYSSKRRDRNAGQIIADVLLPFVLAMSLIWFVRTGSVAPFGQHAVMLYGIAWLGSALTGFVISRFSRRRRSPVPA